MAHAGTSTLFSSPRESRETAPAHQRIVENSICNPPSDSKMYQTSNVPKKSLHLLLEGNDQEEESSPQPFKLTFFPFSNLFCLFFFLANYYQHKDIRQQLMGGAICIGFFLGSVTNHSTWQARCYQRVLPCDHMSNHLFHHETTQPTCKLQVIWNCFSCVNQFSAFCINRQKC